MAILHKKVTFRVKILRGLIIAIMIVYSLNLFSMQVLHKDLFVNEAERISIQSTRIFAPRGEIYDRTGQVLLAGNKEAYSVYITPSALPAVKKRRGSQ